MKMETFSDDIIDLLIDIP